MVLPIIVIHHGVFYMTSRFLNHEHLLVRDMHLLCHLSFRLPGYIQFYNRMIYPSVINHVTVNTRQSPTSDNIDKTTEEYR
jgi:hypothetical protein